jgi:lipoprotein signal peptidase
MRKYHFLIAAVVLLMDRISKLLVEHNIQLHDSIPILPRFFRLTHVQNRGAAFGLGAESTSGWTAGMLIVFSIGALIVVSALLWRNSHRMSSTGVGLALIMGGALGNLWDRVVDGQVVDFLDFYVANYHWPAFNVADSAIVIGAMLLVTEILFSKSTEEQQAVSQRFSD